MSKLKGRKVVKRYPAGGTHSELLGKIYRRVENSSVLSIFH